MRVLIITVCFTLAAWLASIMWANAQDESAIVTVENRYAQALAFCQNSVLHREFDLEQAQAEIKRLKAKYEPKPEPKK